MNSCFNFFRTIPDVPFISVPLNFYRNSNGTLSIFFWRAMNKLTLLYLCRKRIYWLIQQKMKTIFFRRAKRISSEGTKKICRWSLDWLIFRTFFQSDIISWPKKMLWGITQKLNLTLGWMRNKIMWNEWWTEMFFY
jgi:hypothetical protein